MNCRHCNKKLENSFVDLGFQPPSNSYLTFEDLKKSEIYYPLRVCYCTNCWLVQTEDYALRTEFFSSDYAYFSSTSKTWLKHAQIYVEMITNKLNLSKDSFVIEIASNDGYLLKNFVSKNIPCLGIEPTENTAAASEALGIPVIKKFFGNDLVNTILNKGKADLIIGNNVFAHVPDINDFTSAISKILKTNGVLNLEFPYFGNLINDTQFDTIYHEHYSYLSLTSVNSIFLKNGLKIIDIEFIKTHGGSIRVYGALINSNLKVSDNVSLLLKKEISQGFTKNKFYQTFQDKVDIIKNDLLEFLIKASKENKTVVGFGAAAKGNTLLNYCGIKSDLIKFIVDSAESKQNKFMPGSHIPIYSPEKLNDFIPDYILILPWNLKEEIMDLNNHLKDKGTKFVVALPKIKIYE
jgi:SAM-dependent methyltransferase